MDNQHTPLPEGGLFYLSDAYLPRPQVDVELAHGYTLMSINRMAVHAAHHCPWVHPDHLDKRESSQNAWSAMVEHLYASDQKPTDVELLRVGYRAVVTQHEAPLHSRGLRGQHDTPGPRFAAYWAPLARPQVEETAIERVALAQIWPLLTRGQREAVWAVVEHGSLPAAARHLGLQYNALHLRIQGARERFLDWWHQGEKPSKKWMQDWGSGGRPYAAARVSYLRDRRIKSGEHVPSPELRASRGRDIGVTDQELARMRDRGWKMRELSERFGMSQSSIAYRIRRGKNKATPAALEGATP